mgnify:CR=1 FL=1
MPSSNNLFEINEYMISFFIDLFTDENIEPEKLHSSHYTALKESKCTNLIEYIKKNINIYIENVFLRIDLNTKETEETLIELLRNDDISQENKESIIKKEEVLITDINEIPEELWESLVNNYKMYPNWNNVISYYKNKDGIDEFLICYFNLEDNYEKLSKVKLNKDIEISEDFTKEISKEIVLNPEINDESFNYLINSIPYSYNRLSFEELSRKKVEIMISKRFLSFTKANYELLKESFDNLHIKFIEEYKHRSIEKINEFEIDENDLLQIFNSESINKKKKRNIIISFDFDQVAMEKDLANSINEILLPYPSRNIHFDLLHRIIQNGSLTNSKIKLLNINYNNLNKNNIELLLSSLPKPYSDLTFRGKRPTFKKTNDNHKLIENLNKMNYISSFKVQQKTIKVYTYR